MPTRTELIATGRTDEQIAREIGADAVIYQDLDALKAAVRAVNPKLTQFETSCFDGVYITGDVTSEYLASIERQRASRQEARGRREQPASTSTRPSGLRTTLGPRGGFDIAAAE